MKIKILYFITLIVCVIIIVGLSSELSRVNKKNKDSEELIEIQHEMILKLGSLDAVNATINVEVNNRATFGSIKAGDIEIIADQILHYTRKQIIEKDTLCKITSQLYQ